MQVTRSVVHAAENALGATLREGGAAFRVWAPKRERVEVSLGPRRAYHSLERGANGYFTGFVPDLAAGALYSFRLDGKDEFPDPCSRFQPEGPHGPSMIVDPAAFRWTDGSWRGLGSRSGHVMYELHVGAFTPEGTFDAAAARLETLKRLGVTVVEIMPVNEFPGRWNWGYDGVSLFAPCRAYGDVDAFRRFVDRAHAIGLGVLLDVVYNHLGPDGNYLRQYADEYFLDTRNEWGDSLDFTHAPVREFFTSNAAHWIGEYRLDGFRLDATSNIHDPSETHILADIALASRQAAPGRVIYLAAENEKQTMNQVRPAPDGYGYDAQWNDDFQHSAVVALTGRREAYYTDYLGSAQEIVSSMKYGYLYQGQYYSWQSQPRGTAVRGERAAAFVTYLENHDQVANFPLSRRLRTQTSPGRYRAMTATFLLGPPTPLLFMGQEFGATTPFHFFADHSKSLSKAVLSGRREFLSQFPSWREDLQAAPDPSHADTFQSSKLDWAEREKNIDFVRLHEDLLAIRREFAEPEAERFDGAVFGESAFALRWFDPESADRLLVVNLGADRRLVPCPEPLMAPPDHRSWFLHWSSDEREYGGPGVRDAWTPTGWFLPAESATLFEARPR